MSIYHYFPSKQHLFDALVDDCLAGMAPVPDDIPWPMQLRHLMGEFRKAALRHPGFFPYLGLYRMNSQAGLTLLEHALSIFAHTGLPPERIARLFRVLSYYVVGAGLDEALGYAKGPSAAEPVPSDIVVRDFPLVVQAGNYFGVQHHESTFTTGLDILIAAIEREADAAR